MDHVVNHGQAVIEKGSSSFAAAAKLFDPATRGRAYMLYAWCRHCDDQTDDQELGFDGSQLPPAEGRARVDRLRAETLRALSGRTDDDPIYAGLQRWSPTAICPTAIPWSTSTALSWMSRAANTGHSVTRSSTATTSPGSIRSSWPTSSSIRDKTTLDRATDLGLTTS